MNITVDKITEIFFSVDEFCIECDQIIREHSLPRGKGKRNRRKRLSDSEVITITIGFHLGNYRNMKHYYLCHVCEHMKNEFPELVSYNRFVELMQKALVPMMLFLRMSRMVDCKGIAFIDATAIKVCDNHRIHSHKVFKELAELGKSSMGWFYGFKLHLIVDDRGELINFVITPGNVDDRDGRIMKSITKGLWGKLFGDRGYISQKLFESLFMNGIQLITKLKNNMKNCLMSMEDKLLLRKRSIIECINDELKNICQIEHSRHRSTTNFLTNLIAGLIAYTYFPKKPSINLEPVHSNQLSLF
jgi:Transposase DDE domain